MKERARAAGGADAPRPDAPPRHVPADLVPRAPDAEDRLPQPVPLDLRDRALAQPHQVDVRVGRVVAPHLRGRRRGVRRAAPRDEARDGRDPVRPAWGGVDAEEGRAVRVAEDAVEQVAREMELHGLLSSVHTRIVDDGSCQGAAVCTRSVIHPWSPEAEVLGCRWRCAQATCDRPITGTSCSWPQCPAAQERTCYELGHLVTLPHC
ncbi:hypothetical protein BV25DRAFT_693407 [Artomyces pyxidatus]|uniref:Uncharacterized protein n=1 Tax=Artomyces pyxidatus TaxID=48021 RepID=A0ACB8T0Y7_9AGAM|nr:hypothetical protein BV25DRAFT_693407 [Artomyces pyxidatus]